MLEDIYFDSTEDCVDREADEIEYAIKDVLNDTYDIDDVADIDERDYENSTEDCCDEDDDEEEYYDEDDDVNETLSDGEETIDYELFEDEF